VAPVVGTTVVWFVFECVGYSLPSVLFNALLLVTIIFFWAKFVSLLNRLVTQLILPGCLSPEQIYPRSDMESPLL
jgi:hypothetical protein